MGSWSPNRKDEVIAIAGDLIAEGGMERVSIRAIAERAGYSTAIVSHHFRDKKQLLLLAFQQTLERSIDRAEQAIAEGLAAEVILEKLLPLDPATLREWKIWFAFWAHSIADADYQHVQRQRSRQAQDLILHILDACTDISPDTAGGRDLQVSRLFSVIGGLAAHAVFDPEPWPVARQRAVLAAELKSLASV